jgi:hypothetical protein
MAKQRLDVVLVERGICDSRQQAQRVIRAGEVQVNHAVVDKPGTPITADAEILVKVKSPFVSRGEKSWPVLWQSSPSLWRGELPWMGAFPPGGLRIVCCRAGPGWCTALMWGTARSPGNYVRMTAWF